MSDLFIITGASTGLGASISKGIANKGVHLILIARDNKYLSKVQTICESLGAVVDVHSIDLSSDSYYELFDKILLELNWNKYSRVVLFNNASTILPITHLDKASYKEIYSLLNLNLISAASLSQNFMHNCKKYNKSESFVVNISSGASLKSIEGWGLYCISKSGINMLTSVIANDTKDWDNPVQSVAINPGPLDTNMQNDIRQSNVEHSPLNNKFIKMYNDGELSSPDMVARKIIDILNSTSFPNGEYIDFTSNISD
jgi:benzil reductase ((S)-benzoin forming)